MAPYETMLTCELSKRRPSESDKAKIKDEIERLEKLLERYRKVIGGK